MQARVLAKLAENEDLIVVGAEYSVETGVVEFLDDAEAQRNLEKT